MWVEKEIKRYLKDLSLPLLPQGKEKNCLWVFVFIFSSFFPIFL